MSAPQRTMASRISSEAATDQWRDWRWQMRHCDP